MRRGFSKTLTNALLEDRVITRESLEEAERIQQNKGGRLEHILVESGFVESDDMLEYSSQILERMILERDVVITGAEYLLETGRVEFLEDL